jgi:Ca-activated chloride channel family protein
MKTIRALAALLALALAACRGDAPATALPPQETVVFEGAAADKFTPAGEPGTVLVRLRIGTRAPEAAPRAAANVALVVDTSGSMEGEPIIAARAAAAAVVDGLSEGDRLAVIAFGSKPEVLQPPAELDDDAREEIKKKIGSMRAEGTTDMAGGLRAGLDAVTGQLAPQGVNRVVLLGDGVPNDATSIRPLAEEARRRGVSITALGLGADYDETLMGAVAQLSGGRFHYVDDASKVAAFFKNEVLRLQGVYASGAAVELTPGPGVRIDEVIGQRTTPMGGRVRVELGDLSRGEQRDLFVRLGSDPRRAGAPVELCDAVLSYDVPGSGERVERRVFLGARATASKEDLAKGHDRTIEEQAMLAQGAAATLSAIELARSGQAAQARMLITRVAAEMDAAAERLGSDALKTKAGELRALGTDLPKPDPRAARSAPGGQAAEAPSPVIQAAPAVAPAEVEARAKKLRAVHDDAMQRLQ